MLATILEILGSITAISTALSAILAALGGGNSTPSRLFAAAGGIDVAKIRRIAKGDKGKPS